LDFAFCYLDDILIGSTSPEEHRRHLHLVLQRLQELVLNMEKCELARQEKDFLGHHINRQGCIADPEACAGDLGFLPTSRQEAAAEFLGPS
jgi:hypothetical protein